MKTDVDPWQILGDKDTMEESLTPQTTDELNFGDIHVSSFLLMQVFEKYKSLLARSAPQPESPVPSTLPILIRLLHNQPLQTRHPASVNSAHTQSSRPTESTAKQARALRRTTELIERIE